MNKLISLLLIIYIAFPALAGAGNYNFDSKELRRHVEFLASDNLRGRKPGTDEDKKAANYIKDVMKAAGLGLLFDGGFQAFTVISGLEAGKANKLIYGSVTGKLGKDFLPSAFSADTTIKSEIVFVGYGLDIKTDLIKWNDYEKIDVAGKWVVVIKGSPKSNNKNVRFDDYSTNRAKALLAKDKKAAGIIFVASAMNDKADKLTPLTFEEGKSSIGMPAVHITRAFADRLLKQKKLTIDKIESIINDSSRFVAFDLENKIDITTQVEKIEKETRNVAGCIRGTDPALKDEYIVVGAHFDHLGMGGVGSGSRMPDTSAVHNGADDNASGSAALLELIKYYGKKPAKRSIIFVAFGAEEMGALGSKKFVDNPPVDIKKIKFMFNFDMIGRIDSIDKVLTLTGTGTGQGLDSLLKILENGSGLSLTMLPEGAGPSDHSPFYAKDIPVLNFFGKAHMDYHTPFDDTEKIFFGGLQLITNFAAGAIDKIAGLTDALVFRESGPKTAATGNRAGLKTTLGIMPDFSAKDIKGLRVEVVTPGKPASRAGMLKGDVIIAIEGKPINDIYDYTLRMKQFQPGDRINIDILRNGKKEVLIVELI